MGGSQAFLVTLILVTHGFPGNTRWVKYLAQNVDGLIHQELLFAWVRWYTMILRHTQCISCT